MKILGIETSCDDTGIALIDNYEIIENVVLKQEHRKGVIPEYAARAHHIAIYEETKKIIKNQKLDLIAYTKGPGLIGSLFIGSSFAKSLAFSLQVPSIGVNHLEGHLYMPYWFAKKEKKDLEFPYLCLLVSGGHTMMVLVKSVGEYEILGETLDDAVGEVFDKVARCLGLAYPGGPEIEKEALKAKSFGRFKFPFSMKGRDDFSFSGLKTAAINLIKDDFSGQDKADFAYDFQAHIKNMLIEKFDAFVKKSNVRFAVISGGVAANKVLRSAFEEKSLELGVKPLFPPIEFCTDNGLMIASLGKEKFLQEGASDFSLKPSAQISFLS